MPARPTRSAHRPARAAAGFVAALALAVVPACSDDLPTGEPDRTGNASQTASSEGGGGGQSSAKATAVEDPFVVWDTDGTKTLTGHGITMVVPKNWVEYEPEQSGGDGTTWEWAFGLPVGTEPFPAGLQFSAGKPGKGGQLKDGLFEAAKKLAEAAPGYKAIHEGTLDIDGAQEAAFLHFTRTLDYQGKKVQAEQYSMFIQVDDQTSTTIRFIAPEGQWDELMGQAQKSVKVTLKK